MFILCSWMISGCWFCSVHAQSDHPAQAVQCFCPKHQSLEHKLVRAKGSWEAGKMNFCVFCWLRGQEVGLRARLDGQQLLDIGHTQCVSWAQVCQILPQEQGFQISNANLETQKTDKCVWKRRRQPNSRGREVKPLLQL